MSLAESLAATIEKSKKTASQEILRIFHKAAAGLVQLGIGDSANRNASSDWMLIPAPCVVNSDGRIVYVHMDKRYEKSAETDWVSLALRELVNVLQRPEQRGRLSG